MGQNQSIPSTPVPCEKVACTEVPCAKVACTEVPCVKVIDDKKSKIIITEASFGANIDSKHKNNLKEFFEKSGRLDPNVAKIDFREIKIKLNELIKLNNFPIVGVIPKINLIIDFVDMPNNYNIKLLHNKRGFDYKSSNVMDLDNIISSSNEDGGKKPGGLFIDLNDVFDIFNVKSMMVINGCLKLLNIPANFFVVHDLYIIYSNEPKIIFKEVVPDELKPIFENIKIIGESNIKIIDESKPKTESFENTNDNNYIYIIAIIVVLFFLLYNKK